MPHIQQKKRRKADYICHFWSRNCLPKHVVEAKIEIRIEVRGRRRKDISSYWMTSSKREGIGN